jgi:hypothetical protein
MNEIYNITERVVREHTRFTVLSLFDPCRSQIIMNAASRELRTELLEVKPDDLENAVKFAEERRKSVQFRKVIPVDRFGFGAFVLILSCIYAFKYLGVDPGVLTSFAGVFVVSSLATTTWVHRRSSVAITALFMLKRLQSPKP